MYTLHIADKNYSSWSLRPWVLMKTLGIPFVEKMSPFGPDSFYRFREFSPSGLVPVLIDGEITVWDSLAILEHLAETHEGVWPADKKARAFARSAAAEMHSGYGAIRNYCSMTVGQRIDLPYEPPALDLDVTHLQIIWNKGFADFGGPWLAGPDFTAVDAFFAPIAFRVQSYGLKFSGEPKSYVERLLALPAMRQWYDEALAETFRDEKHEEDLVKFGTVTADYRAQPTSE